MLFFRGDFRDRERKSDRVPSGIRRFSIQSLMFQLEFLSHYVTIEMHRDAFFLAECNNSDQGGPGIRIGDLLSLSTSLVRKHNNFHV